MKFQLFKKKNIKNDINKNDINKNTECDSKRILIVDDSNVNRYVIKKLIINIFGVDRFIIDEVENGKLAIQKSKEEEYKIIFIDVKMPVMNGDEAVQEIRKFNNYSFICGITGQIENYNEYIKKGMNKCISKPIDKQILKMIIDEIINYQ
jgi:CheY-like chemotaxis protein